MSFYSVPLEILKELAEEPVAPVDELRALKRQIDMAIGLIESGMIFQVSEDERILHANRFGHGAFVVGDYMIRKI